MNKTTSDDIERATRVRRVVRIEIRFILVFAVIFGLGYPLFGLSNPLVLVSGGLAGGAIWHLLLLSAVILIGRYRSRGPNGDHG